MKFVYSDRYEIDIGAHVYRTDKYRMVRDKLLAEGLARQGDFVEPPEPRIEDIKLVHTEAYVEDMLNLRWTSRTVRSELPLTETIIRGYFLHASGTILACRLALQDKVAMHLGGGFHHAFADHAEGFCYVNDIAIAIKRLLLDGLIQRAAVIDCDLHQGNGTARIFAGDERVFTFSIHQENLYPMKEESDWDIGLDDGVGDDEYLERLGQAVPNILTRHKPDLVLYVAGADPYYRDQLGTLRLTKRGLALRDRLVIEGCYKRGITVVPVLAGGYALDVKDTVDIHTQTARECLRVLGQLPKSSESDATENNTEQTNPDMPTWG